MKSAILTLVPLVVLIIPLRLPAQGNLYVSTLEKTPVGSLAIGTDSWMAQGFYKLNTDTTTYLLDSIQLLMAPASGSPGGLSVSIYSSPFGSGSGPRDNYLGTLEGSTNPSTLGIYTFIASGIMLRSSEDYYVVVTAETPVAQGSYHWSAGAGGSVTGSWGINDSYADSSDGLNWTFHHRQNVAQLGIYATPGTGAGHVGPGGFGASFARHSAVAATATHLISSSMMTADVRQARMVTGFLLRYQSASIRSAERMVPISVAGVRIPTGFHPSAQGWPATAGLPWVIAPKISQP